MKKIISIILFCLILSALFIAACSPTQPQTSSSTEQIDSDISSVNTLDSELNTSELDSTGDELNDLDW